MSSNGARVRLTNPNKVTREKQVAFHIEAKQMKKDKLRPGHKAPYSGQIREIGPRGGRGIEKTISKGERLPPTDQRGSSYKYVDLTKNKSGTGAR